MKLIHNWKDVATRAHSMWAFYASFACLALPELAYWLWQLDTNPRVWWFAGVALLIYGVIGRIKDQGIDRSKTRSPWVVVVLSVVLGLALFLGRDLATGDLDPTTAPPHPPQTEMAATSTATPSPNVAFLEVAVPLIGRWEGLRLTAYRDIIGVWTVCYGETKGVKPGDTYTKAQCDAMLAREIIAYRDDLRPAFTADTLATRLPLERDVSFTSLAYNVGVRATSKSTAVRRLNQGDIAGACQAIGWWNKAGGRVVRGLVNRRAEETRLCMRGIV